MGLNICKDFQLIIIFDFQNVFKREGRKHLQGCRSHISMRYNLQGTSLAKSLRIPEMSFLLQGPSLPCKKLVLRLQKTQILVVIDKNNL